MLPAPHGREEKRDVESVKTLVQAFVTTRLDYCNSVLAGAPRSATDKLQRVLNAAARLVSSTQIRSWSVTSAARRPALLDVPGRV